MNPHKALLTLLVVLVFGLVAWTVEAVVDRYLPRLGVMGRVFVMVLLALGLGLAAVKLAGN